MIVVRLKTLLCAAIAAIILAVGLGGVLLWYGRSVDADAEASENKGVKVPILMYHSVLKDTARSGKYVITPAQMEEDLKYLIRQGYTTIVVQDLVDYVDGKAELPEKPVMLSFDDGYYNNYTYVLPLLEQYRAKAVISVVGTYTEQYTQTKDENPAYAYLSWDNIRAMMDTGLIEFQNHTYDLHSNGKNRSGSKKRKGESEEEYRALLVGDVGKLQSEMQKQLGYTPLCFTYPFGSVSEASFPVLKEMGFRASLSCQEGMNYIERQPEDLYMLKRYLRSNKKSAEKILQ